MAVLEVRSRFGLTTGPRELDSPTASWDIDDFVTYEPRIFVDHLLSLPGFESTAQPPRRAETPAWMYWASWRCLWRNHDERMLFHSMDLSGELSDQFGSIEVDTHCALDSFLGVWRSLHSRFPALWIYDQAHGYYHNERSFVEMLNAAG